jgi:hypothetical protein
MDRPGIVAWQGGLALTHAVMANEAKQPDQFQQHYRRAQDLFAEAMKLGPNDVGVFAITGGSQVTVADRLPPAERKAAWELGYTAYQRLWKMQEQMIEKLPLHHKGEVLSGLAQTADRTGRREEADAGVDRILTLMPNTPYASRARQWKDDPSGRATSKLACQTCHAPGMLVSRIAEVSKQ